LFWRTSHFEKVRTKIRRDAGNGGEANGVQELRKAEEVIRHANEQTFNPVGLNILSPRSVGLQYVSVVGLAGCCSVLTLPA
jgi:predicted N-acetyltransferase YhbS